MQIIHLRRPPVSQYSPTSLSLPRPYLQLDSQITKMILDFQRQVVPQIETNTSEMLSEYVEWSPMRDVINNLRTTVLSNAGVMNTVKALNAQLPGLQQAIGHVSELTASQVLNSTPGLNSALQEMARQLRELDGINSSRVQDETNGTKRPPQTIEPLVDDDTLDRAWHDIEKVLSEDRQLRKALKVSARQMSPKSKTSLKLLKRVLMALIVVSAVVGPWSDGELTSEDAAAPMEIMFVEMLARVNAWEQRQTVAPKQKNILQKNGPRRRRHRRKR